MLGRIPKTVPSCCGLVLAIAVSTTAGAIEAPIAVSPGGEEGFARTLDRCPTFSWSSRANVDEVELVVYRLGSPLPAGMTPVIVRRLPGGVSSWTPSLENCLLRGERFAWTVRFHTAESVSAWASSRLFEVVPADREEETPPEDRAADVEEKASVRRDPPSVVVSLPARPTEPAQGIVLPPILPAFSVDAAGNLSARSLDLGWEDLWVVRGTVATDGAKVVGAGFSSQRLTTGKYLVTFTRDFDTVPTVLATPWGLTNQNVAVASIQADSTEVWVWGAAGALVDGGFHFVVLGTPK